MNLAHEERAERDTLNSCNYLIHKERLCLKV